MHTTDLDEASHEHDEGDTHQQDCPPVGLEKRTEHTSTTNTHLMLRFSASRRDQSADTYHDPLRNVLVQLWVEDGLLQPGQRPVGVHQAALHENVAVALEVVARRASWQRGRFLVEETSQTLRSRAAACVGIHCGRGRITRRSTSFKQQRREPLIRG